MLHTRTSKEKPFSQRGPSMFLRHLYEELEPYNVGTYRLAV